MRTSVSQTTATPDNRSPSKRVPRSGREIYVVPRPIGVDEPFERSSAFEDHRLVQFAGWVFAVQHAFAAGPVQAVVHIHLIEQVAERPQGQVVAGCGRFHDVDGVLHVTQGGRPGQIGDEAEGPLECEDCFEGPGRLDDLLLGGCRAVDHATFVWAEVVPSLEAVEAFAELGERHVVQCEVAAHEVEEIAAHAVEDVEDRACAQVLIGIERRQVVDGRKVPSLKQPDAGGLAAKVGGFHAGGSIRDGGEGDPALRLTRRNSEEKHSAGLVVDLYDARGADAGIEPNQPVAEVFVGLRGMCCAGGLRPFAFVVTHGFGDGTLDRLGP
jgi:hypothetical protein